MLIPLALTLQACPFGYGYKYHTGIFPETPVNLEEFNSEFDDYNATAPTLGQTCPLLYSSSRNSYGENFDIIYKLLTIEFSKTDGSLEVYENKDGRMDILQDYSYINSGLRKVNTTFDEFGPYLIEEGERVDSSDFNQYYSTHILLCSSGPEGSQDICFTHNLENRGYEEAEIVHFLNSESDDNYPALNQGRSRIYFCSNREADFDIYSCEIDPSRTLLEELGDSSKRVIRKEEGLSSEQKDKCPYIAGSLMVFSSDREGGFGGFDLYYSTYNGQTWGKPVNFGETINGPYDEYRPIVMPHGDFVNDFMLFSSNRPGGMGGFDLYYVGIDKR